MKAVLKLEDGREIAVDVSEETLKEIEKPVKKTGYERMKKSERYYLMNNCGFVDSMLEAVNEYDDAVFDNGNYYSDRTVAENNARADTLMRKLRRFAVEHREYELDWNNTNIPKYPIYYSIESHDIIVGSISLSKGFGQIYFDTKETAEAAIEEFKDELLWYFTEYKDSL